jgi:hypothetical protein
MRGRTSYSKSGKPGPSSVDPASKGSNPAANSGGCGGMSYPQKPIPGPASSGQPIAMRKALAKKSRPSKGTSFPGLVR